MIIWRRQSRVSDAGTERCGLSASRRVVLVTGAQQGIGAAVALAFAGPGTCVGLNYLDDLAGAKKLQQQISLSGGQCLLLPGDVSRRSDVERMVEEISQTFGTPDVLVNNAGIFPRAAFLDLDEEMWDRVLDVNLKGVFHCSQVVARRMVTRGQGGAIVNISSIAANGKALGSHYSASKAGVLGLTRSMALELAPLGIRVNAVAPGLIDTAQPRFEHSEAKISELTARIPLGRIGKPSDVAQVVCFLASSQAAFVTGETVYVTGGVSSV